MILLRDLVKENLQKKIGAEMGGQGDPDRLIISLCAFTVHGIKFANCSSGHVGIHELLIRFYRFLTSVVPGRLLVGVPL